MMEPRLQTRFDALEELQRRARFFRALAACWALAAAVGLAILVVQGLFGRALLRQIWILPPGLGALLAAVVYLRRDRGIDDLAGLIRKVAQDQPEVQHLLSTAAEQRPTESSGVFGFLQLRVVEEVLRHPSQTIWRRQMERRLTLARTGHAVAFLALGAVVLALNRDLPPGAALFSALIGEEITVTPGDTRVERGTGLVIAARFGGTPPVEAMVVLNFEKGRESRISMARRLADPVFGASVPEVSEPGVYHIEYRGKKTRDYKIVVFEFPALVRADAELRYPTYTGLTNRTIRDTLRVSAVEGSRLSYTLLLNKSVARARWVGKDHSLALVAQSNAVALLPEFWLTHSARYSLELIDADGLSNKFPTDFVLQALTNQRPDVRLVFPRGDPRVSRLEELQLRAEASDDFGLLNYGIGFGVAGDEPRFVELGQSVPANTQRQFEYLIALETLPVTVDQAVTYFAWADDYGPDGLPRRTFGDMYFAEVRPFEEVFRPDSSGSGESGDQGGGQGGGGDERVKLAELQKQIVLGTWNLQRRKAGARGAGHP
jgi:hypothetical protein